MEKTNQESLNTSGRFPAISLWRVLGWGLIGGLAATLIMDMSLMGALLAFGLPVLTCFSIVGETIARFASIQNLETLKTIQLGMVTHYVVGPVIGAIFGTAVTRVKSLRLNSMKKSLLLGILYVEIMSQPLLATTPILLKMTFPAILQWYGGSFVMHMIAGAVLGAVMHRGLRLANETTYN
jgi:hypothetical protein